MVADRPRDDALVAFPAWFARTCWDVSRALVLTLAILAATLPGCAGAPSGAGSSGPTAPAGARSGPGFSRPPTVDGSRVACLAPPYAPPVDATVLEDGTPIRRESDGRRWVLSLSGDVVPTPDQVGALVERLRARGGDLRWIGYGLYCGEPARGMCLHYEANLCEARVEPLARMIRDAIAADPELPTPRIELAVSLAGALGPRCAADDPACVPLAYDRGTSWTPRGDRRPGPLPQYSGGECRHDGDCVVGGCGNHCMSWDHGGAHEGATCEGYSFREPVFCGCVDARCAWFSH